MNLDPMQREKYLHRGAGLVCTELYMLVLLPEYLILNGTKQFSSVSLFTSSPYRSLTGKYKPLFGYS